MPNTKVLSPTGPSPSPPSMNTSHNSPHNSPPNEPPLPDKPYHSKRPHKKSRTGCKNCKARKVKCDEARPACRSCVLRKTECTYPKPKPSESESVSGTNTPKSQTPEPRDAAASSSRRPQASWPARQWPALGAPAEGQGLHLQPQFRPPQIDSAGMRLLWFYTSTTSDSFCVDPGRLSPVDNILKVRIVQLAFKVPFLMDTLFALASLHLQYLDQTCDTSLALTYRARSFEGYRKAVEEGNPETFPALLANSLLLAGLSSQTFREKDSKDLYILDWMVVWRGVGLMVDMMGPESLFDSGISGLFYRPPIDLDKAAAAIPNHLLFMITSIKPGDVDYPDAQAYYETLKYLGSLFANLQSGPNPIMILRIVTFFTFVPCEFIQCAKERRPRALVIIAHYAAFLKTSTPIWWLDGIGHRTIVDICNYLGPEWHHLLQIPLAARDVDDILAIARVLLGDENWVPPLHREMPEPAAVCLVDDKGREIQWKPAERKLVLLDSKVPGGGLHWNIGL